MSNVVAWCGGLVHRLVRVLCSPIGVERNEIGRQIAVALLRREAETDEIKFVDRYGDRCDPLDSSTDAALQWKRTKRLKNLIVVG